MLISKICIFDSTSVNEALTLFSKKKKKMESFVNICLFLKNSRQSKESLPFFKKIIHSHSYHQIRGCQSPPLSKWWFELYQNILDKPSLKLE